ncbi:UPF0175 family protein [Synechocystis sp. LEGE 06083]|uniref:UPF0175 family protein n=1 Tax=Synechocystis sp. LEGE 06083 TaxID=915336 RepID=UPI001D138B7B|nr:UPF0175 family protein [Synechocystis sp. LEGE 06083]
MEITLIEAYKDGSISVGKLRELLGFSTRLEVDNWLKNNGLNLDYDQLDLAADEQRHQELRQQGKLKA